MSRKNKVFWQKRLQLEWVWNVVQDHESGSNLHLYVSGYLRWYLLLQCFISTPKQYKEEHNGLVHQKDTPNHSVKPLWSCWIRRHVTTLLLNTSLGIYVCTGVLGSGLFRVYSRWIFSSDRGRVGLLSLSLKLFLLATRSIHSPFASCSPK